MMTIDKGLFICNGKIYMIILCFIIMMIILFIVNIYTVSIKSNDNTMPAFGVSFIRRSVCVYFLSACMYACSSMT